MMEWHNVTAGYGGEPILQNLNLSLPAGRIIALIGPNGCGKTTLLKTAARLLPVKEGEILLHGQNTAVFTRRELARQIAVLPQTRNIPDISVNTLVLHGRFPYLGWSRQPRPEDRELAEQAMRQTGVWDYRMRSLRSLSGGERQKAYLAMTVAQDAQWLLLDEPTTYLDIHHQFEILALIEQLQKQKKTIVMVLHDLGQALQYSHYIVLMQSGKIAAGGTPDAIFQSGLLQKVFHVQPHRQEKEKRPFYFFTPLSD